MNYTTCQFNKRLTNCVKSQFSPADKTQPSAAQSDLNRVLDFIVVFSFTLTILTPLMSLFGIVTNLLAIVVIRNKKRRVNFKEKQYDYMVVNSMCNLMVLLLQAVNLVYECQQPYGLFCSTIRKSIFIQFYAVLGGQFLTSFFRFQANFTYVAFAFNRLSLVGQEHDPITIWISTMSLKRFLLVYSTPLSILLSIVKGFQYQVNYFNPSWDYPTMFQDHGNLMANFGLILIFDAISDFVNYVLFGVFGFVVDCLLIRKLRQTMDVRNKQLELMGAKNLEAKIKENEESVRRVILMAVLNGLAVVFLKFPSLFKSINDVRLIVIHGLDHMYSHIFDFGSKYRIFSDYKNFNYYCQMSTMTMCQLIYKICFFLYQFTFSINFFFLYGFDKNFKSVYMEMKSSHPISGAFRRKKVNPITIVHTSALVTLIKKYENGKY